MKTKHFIRIVTLNAFAFVIAVIFHFAVSTALAQSAERLVIQSDPGLEILLNSSVQSYTANHPDVNIQVIPATSQVESKGALQLKRVAEWPVKGSSEWGVTIGKDVWALIAGEDNLARKILDGQGIRLSFLSEIVVNPESRNWKGISEQLNGEIVLAATGDMKGLLPLARLSGDAPSVEFNLMEKDLTGLISVLKQNSKAIGLCSLSELISLNKGQLPEGICLIPIDKNNNLRLDAFEKVYDSPMELLRGAWTGKYPSQLCADVVITSALRPDSEAAQSLISWMLWDGQKIMNTAGFCELTQQEKEIATRSLTGNFVTAVNPVKATGMELWLIVLLLFVGAGIIAGFIIFSGRKSRKNTLVGFEKPVHNLDERTLNCPKGYFFDKSHTWVFLEEEGNLKVGIDDFLQHITGKISRVMLLESGTKVRKGERILSLVNNGRQLNIYSPVTGVIVEKNVTVDTDSGLLNHAPYHEGWLYRIEPLNWRRELDFLMVGAAYGEWVKNEMARLRDFFSTSLSVRDSGLQPVILQDGGEIADHILSGMGPEVWEDFQCHFIDPSR